MFDVGFQELFLLGVIALLVVGPDRLPGLARTVGVWVGKAQRLVGQVRADVERELRADEIRKSMKEFSPAGALSDMRKEVEGFAGEVSGPAAGGDGSADPGRAAKTGSGASHEAGGAPPGPAGDTRSADPAPAGAAGAAGPERTPDATPPPPASAPPPAAMAAASAAAAAGSETGPVVPAPETAGSGGSTAVPGTTAPEAESGRADDAGAAAETETGAGSPEPSAIERDERAAVS